jgi:protein SCO1/2
MRSGILLALLLAGGHQAFSEQKYAAAGLVLRVDPSHRTLLVSCERIPGYTDARTMSVSVRDPNALAELAAGSMVEFTLVTGHQPSYAESIHVRSFEDLGQQGLAARRLKIVESLDPTNSFVASELKVGQQVRSVILIDQNRRETDVAGFRGKVVLMNFFYSHCPLPDYCFRLSNNLGNVQKRFKARMGRDLILLSVTFDPIHDQPEVLANYARTWKAGSDWHFLTGALPEVSRLCAMFGVDVWQDEAELMHSLHTVVIDRDEKLAVNLEGNQFTARQLGDLVETILDQPQ